MVQEKIINGKLCRMYYKKEVWVSEDGEYAGIEKKDGTITELPIKTDKFCNQYVAISRIKSIGFGGRVRYGTPTYVRIDYAVCTAFHGKMPNDGKPYYPAHKDGNKANCSRTNLEWKRQPYVFNKNDSEVIERNGTKVTVYKDGRVKQKGKFLTMGDHIYDADTDLHVVIRPFVYVNVKKPTQEHWSLDDLMDEAKFVHGDKYSFNHPVILHRDYDWKNFNSDNLEFVESNNPEYIKYQAKIAEEHNKRVPEINKGVTNLPDFLFMK